MEEAHDHDSKKLKNTYPTKKIKHNWIGIGIGIEYENNYQIEQKQMYNFEINTINIEIYKKLYQKNVTKI